LHGMVNLLTTFSPAVDCSAAIATLGGLVSELNKAVGLGDGQTVEVDMSLDATHAMLVHRGLQAAEQALTEVLATATGPAHGSGRSELKELLASFKKRFKNKAAVAAMKQQGLVVNHHQITSSLNKLNKVRNGLQHGSELMDHSVVSDVLDQLAAVLKQLGPADAVKGCKAGLAAAIDGVTIVLKAAVGPTRKVRIHGDARAAARLRIARPSERRLTGRDDYVDQLVKATSDPGSRVLLHGH
jgi:hypothetical protein